MRKPPPGPAAAQWQHRPRLAPAVLAQLLKADISSGKYAVGGPLPTEQALQAEFGASRYCVRAALQLLKNCGMVAARAGIGHAVLRASPVADRYMHGSSTLEELIQATGTTLRVLDSRAVSIDAPLAQSTGFLPGARALRVDTLRSKTDSDLPIALLTLFLHEAHQAIVPHMEGRAEPFHLMLEQRYGVAIHEVRQSIVAAKIDRRGAKLLRSAAQQPCLRITRRFLDGAGEAIFTSIGLYPSDRFSHDTAIRVFR